MRGGVGLLGVVQVVGRNQRQLQILRDLEQIGTYSILDGQAVIHELDEVVAGTEEIAELRRAGKRVVVATQSQVGLYLSAGATCACDQSIGVPGKQFAIDPRLVKVALK